MYIIVGLVGMLYKAYLFRYPFTIFLAEFLGLILLYLVQSSRLFIGSKGNKCERSGVTFLFVLVTIITQLGLLYYAYFQTYVLQLDFILAIICLIFGMIEFFGGVFAAINFKSIENSV